MKQGLSLRVSQHLALTPQLQQSIRLLQLSTLELSQEIQQMLDDNPFLEAQVEDGRRGIRHRHQRCGARRRRTRWPGRGRSSFEPAAPAGEAPSASTPEAEPAEFGDDSTPNWEGDGTTETVPDDGEWGGEAPARRNNTGDEDDVEATDLARGNESLQSWLHRQALTLRLSEEDRMALRFLIESLNDDGYLEEPLEELARGTGAGRPRAAGGTGAALHHGAAPAAEPGSARCRRAHAGRVPAAAAQDHAGGSARPGSPSPPP
jgi:RNA polymerase sigma-54 factor